MLGVVGLEHLRGGPAAKLDPEPLDRGVEPRHLVPQRLEQAPDAVILLGRTDQHRHDIGRAHALGQVAVNLLDIGNLVFQKLFQQFVVEVGERLQHRFPGQLVFIGDGVRHVDALRAGAGGVSVGPPADQIDVTRNRLAFADGDLAQHQRRVLDGTQRFVHRGDRLGDGVDLVDEDHVGDAAVGESLEQRREGHRALGRGFVNHHRQVGDQQGVQRFLPHLDRARAVEEGPLVVEIGGRADRDLDRHLAGTRFRRGIAHGVAFLDRTLAVNPPRHREQALHQGGLAAQIGSD